MKPSSEQFIEWDAYEYQQTKRSTDWYWAFWIIALSLSAVSAIFHNITFAILIIVGTFALSLFAARPPSLIHHEINTRGVVSGKLFYPYESLESFGIDMYTPTVPKLLLKSKKTFLPYITLPLEDVDVEEVRTFLENYLHSADHQEPFINKMMERFGF